MGLSAATVSMYIKVSALTSTLWFLPSRARPRFLSAAINIFFTHSSNMRLSLPTWGIVGKQMNTCTRLHACTHSRICARTHGIDKNTFCFFFHSFCVFCTYCIWNFRVTKLRYRSQSAKSQRIPKRRAAWGFFFLFFVFFTNKYPSDTTHDMTPVHTDLCYF